MYEVVFQTNSSQNMLASDRRSDCKYVNNWQSQVTAPLTTQTALYILILSELWIPTCIKDTDWLKLIIWENVYMQYGRASAVIFINIIIVNFHRIRCISQSNYIPVILHPLLWLRDN